MKRGLALLLAVLGAAASVSACSPTGDLGRARSDVLSATVLPALHDAEATFRGQGAGDVLQTDEERQLQDRLWRFLASPLVGDSRFRGSARLRRIQIETDEGMRLEAERYYAFLQNQDFKSSRGRYRALSGHIRGDIALLPPLFASVCSVQEIDRRRRVALDSLTDVDPRLAEQMYLRIERNRHEVGYLLDALRYRQAAYGLALERLLLETPHEEAVAVDGDLSQFSALVVDAERGAFCGTRGSGAFVAAAGQPISILPQSRPSRLSR